MGFGLWDFGTKGLGPGLDNNVSISLLCSDINEPTEPVLCLYFILFLRVHFSLFIVFICWTFICWKISFLRLWHMASGHSGTLALASSDAMVFFCVIVFVHFTYNSTIT